MTLDPVTLAVIQNGLRQVASEMHLVHEKTLPRAWFPAPPWRSKALEPRRHARATERQDAKEAGLKRKGSESLVG